MIIYLGAIILDCVLGFDDTKNSQDVEDDWYDLVPEAFASILVNYSELATLAIEIILINKLGRKGGFCRRIWKKFN